MIRFGPSGNSEAFYNEGYKESIQAPKWIFDKGLTAYEYSLNLGRFLSDATAEKIANEARKYDIKISVHAPYYINFCNPSEISYENNFRFLLNSLHTLRVLGGEHCVFHIGSQLKMARQEAFGILEKNFKEFLIEYHSKGFDDMFLCPETMGKFSPIGTVDEIYQICGWDKMLIPTLDFGHINCITGGALKSKQDFIDIFQKGIDTIGREKMQKCHIHFSKIKYNTKGEVCHLTFEDQEYGPNPEYMLQAVDSLGLEPVIICESKGTQANDARFMKDYYGKLVKQIAN